MSTESEPTRVDRVADQPIAGAVPYVRANVVQTIVPMSSQPESSTQEVLAGLVERVTFQNAENGFCVVRTKARGHRDLVTVVGHAATIAVGERITASGEWVNDRVHGQQFKARFLRTSAPNTVDGIEKYLASGSLGATPDRLCYTLGHLTDYPSALPDQ